MRKTLEAEMEKPGNVVKSDEEWRKTLTPEEYRVTRQHGTERAFSHPYSKEKSEGMYRCVCCGTPCSALKPNTIPALAGRAFMPRPKAAQ